MKLNSMYSFFILVDTNDPLNFHIEMTKMNYRLRFSALKSNHIRKYGKCANLRIHTNVSDERMCTLPGYHNVLKSNYTFYLLDKKICTPGQANEHKLNLIELYKKGCNYNLKNKFKFTMTFSFWIVILLVVADVVGFHQDLHISPTALTDFFNLLVVVSVMIDDNF